MSRFLYWIREKKSGAVNASVLPAGFMRCVGMMELSLIERILRKSTVERLGWIW